MNTYCICEKWGYYRITSNVSYVSVITPKNIIGKIFSFGKVVDITEAWST